VIRKKCKININKLFIFLELPKHALPHVPVLFEERMLKGSQEAAVEEEEICVYFALRMTEGDYQRNSQSSEKDLRR